MPLIMGILAQGVAAPPAAADAYDLLATEILTGSQSSVTFSNLNSTYGADYQHLQVRMTLRSDRAGANEYPRIGFNNDAGSNYAWHWLQGNGSSVSSSAASSDFLVAIGLVAAGSTAGTDVFGASVMDILDPFETTKYTTLRAFGGALVSGASNVYLNSGLWMNTAALTDINIDQQYGSNWVAGTRISLYGLKAA